MALSLAGLLPLLNKSTEFNSVCERINGQSTGQFVQLSGLGASARPFFLAALQSCVQQPILVVTARPNQARTMAEQIVSYSSHPDAVQSWLTSDTLPYDRIEPDNSITAARLTTLASLTQDSKFKTQNLLIVASAKGLMQPTLSPRDFEDATLTFKQGQKIEMNEILGRLVRLGYAPESVVESQGQFSRRGGILDMWPTTFDQPVRIDFFDDEIDTMRRFDAVTQRSRDQLKEVVIVPPLEIPVWRSGDALERLRNVPTDNLRPEVLEEWHKMLQHLDNNEPFEGVGQFAAYFAEEGDERQLYSLLDYLPNDTIVVYDGPSQLDFAVQELSGRAEQLRTDFENEGELPSGIVRPYLTWKELTAELNRMPRLSINRLNESDDLGVSAAPIDNSGEDFGFFENASEYVGQQPRLFEDVERWIRDGQRVVIVTQQADRLREQFEERDIFAVHRKENSADILAGVPGAGSLNILPGGLINGGWKSGRLQTVLLTDREIFGWSKQPNPQQTAKTATRTMAQREAFLRDLQPGDYVVHIEHGVARYEGLVRFKTSSITEFGQKTEEVEREFLFLKYAEADKLYVPIEQVDRVLPYTAPGNATPQLNRLGSAEWTRSKRKVRAAVEDMAKELLELYSKRASKPGHAFSPDNTWQREMEEAFPYNETPDQLRAISDVKSDMEQPHPMDRLICGDVGYGKTEVALRAAFKAVMDGRQVAMLVPTTILAQQHFNTFTERLKQFPTNIEMLSRFRSKKEQTEALAKLAKGQIDIMIGTHRLLQKDVVFKNLGLLIIDEEQRFGVRAKERLKQMRAEVDVLTLSATPIPRTLYMSLSGVRDISIIETPPEQRLPVKTYVTAANDELIKEAITREIERGGQVFYVHNRVNSIAQVASYIQKLVPQARVIVGHGQMEDTELERVMAAFTEHEADVLVCTTIIESGLDIPNANTLVMDNAVMYGLAQLYQLRGRVGRSSKRAYAYLLYQAGATMTEDAQKRLDTMLDNQELGAGFKIAMKDMEIRGAGNILGSEQSGNIATVGFELYMRLLEEAIEQQRGDDDRPIEALVEAPTVNMTLPLPAYLPEDYISDQALRLDMYRRLAQPLKSGSQVRDIVRELEDRFGPLPDAVQNLMYLLDIKVLAIRAGVETIQEQDSEISLRWPAPSVESEMRRQATKVSALKERPKPTGRANVDPRRLMREFGDSLRITPNQIRLNIRRLAPSQNWQDRLKTLLEELASTAPAAA